MARIDPEKLPGYETYCGSAFEHFSMGDTFWERDINADDDETELAITISTSPKIVFLRADSTSHARTRWWR